MYRDCMYMYNNVYRKFNTMARETASLRQSFCLLLVYESDPYLNNSVCCIATGQVRLVLGIQRDWLARRPALSALSSAAKSVRTATNGLLLVLCALPAPLLYSRQM